MQPEDQFGNPIEPEPESPDLVKQRTHIESLEKDLAKERDRRAKLEAKVAEQEARDRVSAARTAFKEAGLPEAQADLYLKANPDGEVNSEAAKAFATQYGFTPTQAEEGEPAPPPPAQERSWEPTDTGIPSGPSKITEEELGKRLKKGDIDYWMWAQEQERKHPGSIDWKYPDEVNAQ